MHRLGYTDRKRSFTRAKRDYIEDAQRFQVSLPKPPDAWACAKRLKSSGHVVKRHLGTLDGWHAFETDKGTVAIKRHLDGHWEIRRKAA